MQNKFSGLKILLLILSILFVALFAVDKILPLVSFKNTTEYNDGKNTIYMRYEKTPASSLLSVADAQKQVAAANFDVSGFEKCEYPLIDDMPSSESYDKNTVEIVVFGDSFVWGEASLNRNELFWRQMERILREAGYNCRVSAIAMAGATAYEELNWYKNYLKVQKPDLVVFGYVYNDGLIDGSDYSSSEYIDFQEKLPVLNFIHALFPNIYQKLTDFISMKTIYNEKYGDKYRHSNIAVLKGKLRDYYVQHFVDELEKISKTERIPAIVMTLPNTPGLMLKELYKPLHEIYKNSSVYFYDLIDDFNQYWAMKPKNNLYVNPVNSHPGSGSHRFYAEYLVNILKNDFSDVLGDQSDDSLLSNKICINDCTPYQIDLKTESQTEHCTEISFSFPDSKKHDFYFFEINPYYLTYPINKNYIKLSFENPVDISRIEMSGVNYDQASLYYTVINKKLSYDDNILHSACLTDSEQCLVSNEELRNVSSLCVSVNTSSVIKIEMKIYS